MKNIHEIAFHPGSREELLPDFAADFHYIASRAEMDCYIGRSAPWHWHKAVEIFYMESGSLTYYTPGGAMYFPTGSGGMINSNVLHMTKAMSRTEENVPLLHLFDPSLIAGEQGSRIEQRYVTPVTTASQLEILPLFPENPAQKKILDQILHAFRLSDAAPGYEIRLREALSEIWLLLFEEARPLLEKKQGAGKSSESIKQMMVYVHEHYSEKISVAQIAEAAFLSERECFRLFRDCLHMTPAEYIKSYRLQKACQMLAGTSEPLTVVSQACGLGSSSYFGKVFREHAHCTPSEYRQKWQDFDR